MIICLDEDEILEGLDEDEAFLDHEDFMWHLEREDRHGKE